MKPITVMLVDDNPTFLGIAARFLQQHDEVRVVSAAVGGEEAIGLAQAIQPQVILLDLAMPELPGLKAIPLLREALPRVGIIALTLLNTDGYRQAALAAGANDFVAKGNMNTELLPAIRKLATAHGDL